MSIDSLRNRIDLVNIPFTERGSRIMLFRQDNHFSIRLAERWAKWEDEIGHYRKRPPLITDICFLSESGQLLPVQEVETFPHCVHVRTTAGQFDWTFVDPDSLLIRLPAGIVGLSFNVYAEHGGTDWRGGVLYGKRNISYTTNARLLENLLEHIDKDHLRVQFTMVADTSNVVLLNITTRLGFNRSLPTAEEAIAQSYERWREWFAAIPPVLDEYRTQYAYAWWIMRSGLVNTRYYFTREALFPSKIHYVGVWHWDQAFHALAYRHVDTNLAENQLRIVFDHQRPNGMLPDAIHDEGLITHLSQPVDADVTKPPIISWVILKMYESSRHLDFLKEVYEPLVRWNRWWMTENSNGEGLCLYKHPFSSGLDDSPLWDYGMPVVSPDLNTYLVLQNRSLAQISQLIGLRDSASQFEQQANQLLNNMMSRLWDDEAGLFQAQIHGRPVPILTPFNLLPLLIEGLPEHMVKRLVIHLTDPSSFWSTYPLATVTAANSTFSPTQMWRGPVWINVNYLFVEALKMNRQPQLAAALRRKTLDLMLKHNDFYEYYNPLNGERPPKAAPMFGWSAALFIELAIDETRWRNNQM